MCLTVEKPGSECRSALKRRILPSWRKNHEIITVYDSGLMGAIFEPPQALEAQKGGGRHCSTGPRQNGSPWLRFTL